MSQTVSSPPWCLCLGHPSLKSLDSGNIMEQHETSWKSIKNSLLSFFLMSGFKSHFLCTQSSLLKVLNGKPQTRQLDTLQITNEKKNYKPNFIHNFQPLMNINVDCMHKR